VVKRVGGLPGGGCRREPAGRVAQRGEVGEERLLVRRADRRDGERDGPPALAPGEHLPRPPLPGDVLQAERRQFRPVRGGLGPQLR